MSKAQGALNIVLVEDSEDLAKSLEEVFSLDGHALQYFLAGQQALAAPDVIKAADILVTDYYLTDMNGMDVINQVRAINPQLPVILLSGAREPAVLNSLRQLKQAVFLPKPVDLDELEKRIYQLTSKK
jgi:DNA-binding NtrC family response regulator